MLTRAQKKAFERDGFLCVPAVLTQTQVQELRQKLIGMFDSEPIYEGDFSRGGDIQIGEFRSVRRDFFARYPEFRWIVTHPPIMESLRDLLGREFVLVAETVALDSGYGGWHKDTQAQELAGMKFHYEPDYRVVEVVLYLQDNTPEYGGGLEVIPGSHILPSNGKKSAGLFRSHLEAMRRWLGKPAPVAAQPRPAPYPIPSKAGDLVIFHYRIDHKATWPTITPIPPEHRKLGIFFGCSSNNRHATSYGQFLANRPEYTFLKNGPRYPSDFLTLARSKNIILQ